MGGQAAAAAHLGRVYGTSEDGLDAEEYQELADEVREASDLVANAAEKLRSVCEVTDDSYRLGTMVAGLETMCDTGGWCGLDSEKLETWAAELEAGGPNEEYEEPEELDL